MRHAYTRRLIDMYLCFPLQQAAPRGAEMRNHFRAFAAARQEDRSSSFVVSS
jgi:hypothetical protein